MTPPESRPKTEELFARAISVIPGGIYGHMSPAHSIPEAAPYFAERAEGCRYWDIDGREFIDFMCGFGTMILGYAHAEIESVATAQRARGNCFNHPTQHFVELAEELTSRIDFASWAVFGKNGSDMTTWSIQVAREATGRKKILMVRGAYHGVDAWCTPGHGGLIPEDRLHVHSFCWNDAGDFKAALDRYSGEIAAVIITPFHHPAFGQSDMPEEGFIETIESSCREQEIVFILDDIRAGFRLHSGGSHRFFGFDPDISCFCKALGNGYPISSAVGREALRVPASKVFLTGSYWNNAVPMAVAKACLRILDRDRVIDHLDAMGRRLIDGLLEVSRRHGIEITASGPPALPYITFAEDRSFRLMQRFCRACMEQGVFFHPHHNWFLSAAHHETDIDQAIDAAELAFSRLNHET